MPMEKSPPYWLTNKAFYELEQSEYAQVRTDFMDVPRIEGRLALLSKRDLPLLSEVMESTWARGTF